MSARTQWLIAMDSQDELTELGRKTAKADEYFQKESNYKTGGGMAGAYAGGKTGAAIGTYFAPGIGTMIGAGIGTALGYVGGAKVGEEFAEKSIDGEWNIGQEDVYSDRASEFHTDMNTGKFYKADRGDTSKALIGQAESSDRGDWYKGAAAGISAGFATKAPVDTGYYGGGTGSGNYASKELADKYAGKTGMNLLRGSLSDRFGAGKTMADAAEPLSEFETGQNIWKERMAEVNQGYIDQSGDKGAMALQAESSYLPGSNIKGESLMTEQTVVPKEPKFNFTDLVNQSKERDKKASLDNLNQDKSLVNFDNYHVQAKSQTRDANMANLKKQQIESSKMMNLGEGTGGEKGKSLFDSIPMADGNEAFGMNDFTEESWEKSLRNKSMRKDMTLRETELMMDGYNPDQAREMLKRDKTIEGYLDTQQKLEGAAPESDMLADIPTRDKGKFTSVKKEGGFRGGRGDMPRSEYESLEGIEKEVERYKSRMESYNKKNPLSGRLENNIRRNDDLHQVGKSKLDYNKGIMNDKVINNENIANLKPGGKEWAMNQVQKFVKKGQEPKYAPDHKWFKYNDLLLAEWKKGKK